uniref:Uncharacterized protein n=1 Tax=Trypanosoma vivax (strain Y486) TaxID=1055687 RepID=G0UAL2_TRYVY|nr:hypothetical protein TVY486_1103290 [Trypanosoma vivax Y486]
MGLPSFRRSPSTSCCSLCCLVIVNVTQLPFASSVNRGNPKRDVRCLVFLVLFVCYFFASLFVFPHVLKLTYHSLCKYLFLFFFFLFFFFFNFCSHFNTFSSVLPSI